ncbi:MAG: hypothetical protein QOH08_963 [Chloroflexota bacterium]|nr:hypothetical protein [Chloroflexota bacterium]
MTRVAICGGDELRAACEVLGLEPTTLAPRAVLVDLRIAGAAAAAAGFAADIPRIVVATSEQATWLRSLGGDHTPIAQSADAAVIGPLVARCLPHPARQRTRVITVTAARGGTGRTLCVANLARRIAEHTTVLAVDATGSGSLGWWLGVEARSWSELDALAGELRAEHLQLVATSVRPRLSVAGGPPVVPSAALLGMAIAAARELADLVIVDAPVLADERARAAAARSDRVLVLGYADPASLSALIAADVPSGAWLIGAQGPIAGAFRDLPRDERSISDALRARDAVDGQLGRSYDDLAELLAIDAA